MIGGSGLATVVLHVNARYFVIGWADSNNMDNSLRRHIVSYMSKKGLEMLEICIQIPTQPRAKGPGKDTMHLVVLQIPEWPQKYFILYLESP